MPFDWYALILTFIPLFVAIDALGVVPLFLSITGGMGEREKRTLISEATLAALAVMMIRVGLTRMVHAGG